MSDGPVASKIAPDQRHGASGIHRSDWLSAAAAQAGRHMTTRCDYCGSLETTQANPIQECWVVGEQYWLHRAECQDAWMRDTDPKRRKVGARSNMHIARVVFLANALSRTKPWQAQGLSRATWYRRRREAGLHETGLSAQHSETGLETDRETGPSDTPVSPRRRPAG
jgi:hypothetical protein